MHPNPYTHPSPEDSSAHADILLDADDLEEALISGDEAEFEPLPEELESTGGPLDTGTTPWLPPPWPALRRTSVSVRKISPVVGFDPHEVLHDVFGLRNSMQGTLSPAMSNKSSAPAAPSIALKPTPGPYLAAPPSGPNETALPPIPEPGGTARGAPPHLQWTQSVVTGAINAIIGMPIMLSFATIIFRHQFFSSFLSPLTKLVFLSSALHQTVFAASSSMPYAVGQVQDVGLIFLSAIATSVVDECSGLGVADRDIIGTVLMTLTLSTAIVGVLIVGTGLLKLASLVQYCPLPVVGGYLAYVGWFCLMSGMGLAAGVQLSGPRTLLALIDWNAGIRLAPAVAMAVALSVVQRRFRSPLALPVLLVAVPLIFYAVIFSAQWPLDVVRSAGWMAAPQPEDAQWRFWNLYELYHIDSFPPRNIVWSAVPRQIGKLAGLFFVVAFGSSMDIAAIQSEAPEDLDYNSELVTVGVSNLVTGCVGVGFTGSYIFSQTLFSLRMGVNSPVMGAVVAVAEAIVFAMPVNLLAYIPNFYFGALVIWIGYDIAKDWLFIAAKKLSPVEYGLLLLTFTSVTLMGLEAGIAVGIIAAALHFAYEYARVSVRAFTVVPSRSGAVRSFAQRMVLETFTNRVVAVALSGMVFFGSATSCAERVLQVAASLLETQPRGSMELAAPFEAHSNGDNRPHLPVVPSEGTLLRTYDGVEALKNTSEAGIAGVIDALQSAPLVLLLDLSRVHGMDATAARTFLTLQRRLSRRGVRLVLTGLRHNQGGDRLRRVLEGQGLVLPPETDITETSLTEGSGVPVQHQVQSLESHQINQASCMCFATMDEGLHWCEEAFLAIAERHGLCELRAECVTLEDVLRHNLELPALPLGRGLGSIDHSGAAAMLDRFIQKRGMRKGNVVFRPGDPSDAIYIVECGAVLCATNFLQTTVHSRAAAAYIVPNGLAGVPPARILTYGPGGIFGDLDFLLQRPRSFTAECGRAGTLWILTRTAFEQMALQAPHVLVLLQTVILRLNCLSASHALEALERCTM